MKMRKLSRRAVMAIICFSVLIVMASCIAVIIQYRRDIMERYSNQALSYAKTAAEYIDGDKISQYIETGKKDDYYVQVQNFLNLNQKNSDLKYYYVYIPYEDDLVYIWDADTTAGACGLGEHEHYMEGGKEASFAVFCKEPPEKILFFQDETYGYIASAFYPVFNHLGDPVALVGVDVSMPGITDTIFRFVFHIIVSMVIVIAIFSAGFFVFLNARLIRPIGILNQASKELVSNLEKEEEFQADIHTRDEIEELAHSFEHMNREVKEYIHRLAYVTAEKERIGAELNVATKIQANMLPSIFPPFPERSDMDLYAIMRPAKEVGGDFYDFFLIDDMHLGMVMADVSGKGIPAALFMVVAKTLIKNRALMGGTPAEILSFVNNQLCENNEAEMFVTVWLGILDLSSGVMKAANAGHEYPVVKRDGGKFELYKEKHGFVLAGMPDARYTDYEVEFRRGDMLYVYTDGVIEAMDSENHLFGREAMLQALNRRQDATCGQVLQQVMESIEEFVGDAPQFDDITMLCLTYYGEEDGKRDKSGSEH